MKNSIYSLFLIITLFISSEVFAQPANDNCAGAINLVIGAVPPCGTGVQTSANTTVSGSITTATPGNPYIYQTGCTGASTAQAFPANDVWYKYVATGYDANITVTSMFANPNISVYAGSCAALGGGVGGCATGTGGSATLLVQQMVVGTTYYIQVSGGTGQTGTFNLSINNTKSCSDCLIGASLTVNPLPVNGAYAPGTTVNFCYHINQYNHVNTNWLHGVQLTFGSGWNAASLTASAPTSTSTGGSWSYYPSAVGTVNGVNWGPGWYWDTSDIGTSPTNNFGDPAINSNAGMWNFCMSLTTPLACTPGSNLSVAFNTSGDGESGSWSSSACSGDAPTVFNAIGACCPPVMSSLPLNCFGVPTGSATAAPIGTQGPYTYNWSGPASYSSSASGIAGANTITNLDAGTYTVQIIDKNLCAITNTIIVTQPTLLTATVTPVNSTCSSAGSITTAASGGTPAYTYTWSGPSSYSSNTQSPTGLTVAGVYTLIMSDTKGCTLTKTVTIASTGTVTSTFTGAGTQCFVGNTFTFNNTGSTGAGITHAYSFSPTTGAPAASPTNTIGTYGPVSFTAPGTYTVTQTVVNGVCINTTTATVIINPNPLATLTPSNPTCGLSNGLVFINNTSCCAQTITGFASSLGSVSGQTVTGLGASTPIITLTNSSGCTFTVSTTLTMTPFPTAITTTTVSTTCGNANGSLSFVASPGTAPYTYSVNGTAATSPTAGLAAGSYVVLVKDFNGCTFSVTATISNIPGPTAMTVGNLPASCAGATGSATVTGVTGGTPTYSYAIDGGAFGTSATFGALASGTHTIVVKDANACTFTTTAVVGLQAGITSATVNASTASCGTANGTSTVTGVTGGVPTYSYSFDGGGFGTSTSTSGLAAGNHTVIIKDVNTCTLSVPYTVLSLGSPTVSITSFSNTTCFGLSNGSCTVAIPTGGAGAPYTYSLTTPLQIAGPTAGTGAFSGLPAGSYNITVKDAAGCIATTTVTISEPTQVSITTSSLPVKCFGTPTGTINVVGAGGTPTYSYNLNGSATYQASTVFANQSAGTYLMGVKDSKGCTATQTVIVAQPPALAISVSSQNANCTAANGIGSATVTGGTGTITYTWTPTGGAAAVSNSVAAGNYTVIATDANGCIISSPVVVGLTPGGTAAITGSTNITCFNANNGSITAGMIGGTANFSYLWTPGGQTTATAINLAPGTYSCTITDFYGCIANTSGTITQPTVLTAIMNSNNVKCFGTPTGTVSAAGSGGSGGYTYSWPTLASTLSTVPNVAIGNYSCTITDANGCSITASITVTQPTSITLSSTVTPANCGQANGTATITASGGSGTYSYTWSTTGSTTISQPPVVANTYTVQVKDANNCFQTLAVTIPNTAGPTISITSQTNVACFGICSGVATTSVSGGIPSYTYLWSNGQVTPSGTNLCAGLYTVSATDQAGCVTSTSVSITQPTALTVTISPTNPKCFGATNGFGTAAAIGGTPSYTFAWSPASAGNSATSNQIGAGNYGLTVTDGKGCVVTSSMALANPPAMAASITSTNVTCFNVCNGTAVASSTNGVGAVNYVWSGGASPVSSQTLTGACSGTYNLLATDQNSCTANSSIIITQPTQVTANISSTGSVTCFGGNNGFASVTPGGGTGAFSYTWTPNGTIHAATAGSLTAGSYVATVSDANGCTATATATVLQPAAFTTTLTTANVKCNGACDGTGNIAFSGGVGVPTFLWQPGLQAGNSVSNLCAGNQTVTITSNGSCTNVLTFTLTEPSPLTAVASATNSNCGQANGKTCVVLGGGTAPYSSIWSNGATTLCNNNIIASAYSYTVTDANLCKVITSGLVNDIAGPVVTITSQTNISCFNGNNGAATTTVTGGVFPYTYLWTGTSYTTPNVSTFNVGIKNITVTDAAGCVGNASVQITEPTQLVSAIGSFTNVSCFGQTNGGATILVNGGTPNYSYSWTPSTQTSSVMIGVGANNYICNVVDGNGCATSKPVTISQPAALVITASSFTNISCFGGNNGQISVTIQGGTPTYTNTWTPAQNNSPFISGLTAGGYTLAVIDQNNCTVGANFTILEPSQLTSSYVSLPATCGNANGSATVTIGGGTPAYGVSWNTPGAPTGTVAINIGGGSNWIATITDSKGCSITQTVAVANPPVPVITGFNVAPPTCFGLPNGTITVNYSSGTSPYTVNWANPISQTITTSALTQSVSGIGAGLYNVTVTDSYSCSTTQPVNVTQPNMLVLMPSANTTICYGLSAQISASSTGGTAPYTYSWTPNTFVGGGPHTVNPTTTTSYIVSVSDNNGCSRPPQVITIAVTPSLAISGFAVTKCEGQFTTLVPTITSPGKGGLYSFTWSNGVVSNSVSTSSISVLATMPTPNQYTVTIDDNCTIPTASAVFTVNVNPLPVISFTANPRIGCAPLTVSLTGTSNGANDQFNWVEFNLIGGPQQVVTLTDTGFHQVSLIVTNTLTGCSSSHIEKDYIYVYAQPIASFYADPFKASILDPNINFVNTSQGATSYYWDFGDPVALNGSNTSTVVNPSHVYGYTGEYKVNLVAISIHGCRDIASQLVEITPDFALYIPNAFTPDENGLNDIFQPLGVGIDEDKYRLDIFDRWGENIFTSNNFRKGWDGSVKGGSKPAPQGVYTYKLMVHDLQGNKHPFVGHVTVIRRNNN
ncbi:MAG: gliding motility-associated C-terminal domain-containing protein [Burkholderiales bacterium]|nr:gliding motility-associated C-terminal domain-containing protein [Bacteroidia bacterium]